MPFSIHPFRFFPMVFASLITLLLLSNEPAHAEWVSLGENPSGMTVYVNPDTIRRKGERVKMWVQYDYKTIQTVAEQASRICLKGPNSNSTAQKGAIGSVRLWSSLATWDKGNRLKANHTKASGTQYHQTVFLKICGNMHAGDVIPHSRTWASLRGPDALLDSSLAPAET